MKNLFEHIEHVKTKPHHIRKQVAFTMAGGVTGIIALVWLSVSLSANAFAIQGSNFADATQQDELLVASSTDASTTGLAGAAAALPDTSGPARIEIVNVATSAPATHASATVIPF